MSKESYKQWYGKNKEAARKSKAENMRRYRSENPEKFRQQSKNYRTKLRNRLFELYGHTCEICGFEDKRALTLDHIRQNGNEERKRIGERGVFRRARDNYLPEEYRTLCMNCQFIERHKNSNQTN
jgi:hypothetical protein